MRSCGFLDRIKRIERYIGLRLIMGLATGLTTDILLVMYPVSRQRPDILFWVVGTLWAAVSLRLFFIQRRLVLAIVAAAETETWDKHSDPSFIVSQRGPKLNLRFPKLFAALLAGSVRLRNHIGGTSIVGQMRHLERYATVVSGVNLFLSLGIEAFIFR